MVPRSATTPGMRVESRANSALLGITASMTRDLWGYQNAAALLTMTVFCRNIH
jgi:hypothetical protein